jgi:hypothetical protein
MPSSKSPKIKPVKGWAVVYLDSIFESVDRRDPRGSIVEIFKTKQEAELNYQNRSWRAIPVLLTPLTPCRKAKK